MDILNKAATLFRMSPESIEGNHELNTRGENCKAGR